MTSVELPGSVLVIAPVDHFRRLARKVMAIADVEVYHSAMHEGGTPSRLAEAM